MKSKRLFLKHGELGSLHSLGYFKSREFPVFDEPVFNAILLSQESNVRFYLNFWPIKYANTAWKVSKYGVFSGPYFPALGLNTERYSVSLHIQSECRKIWTKKNSVFGHFSRSATLNKECTNKITWKLRSLLPIAWHLLGRTKFISNPVLKGTYLNG